MILPPSSPQAPRAALYRVEFRDGFAITTKAANSLKAEQIARRQRPGIVMKVKILKGTRP